MKSIKKIMIFAVFMSMFTSNTQAFFWNIAKKKKPVITHSAWYNVKKHLSTNKSKYIYGTGALVGAALIVTSYKYGNEIYSCAHNAYNKLLGWFGFGSHDPKKDKKIPQQERPKISEPHNVKKQEGNNLSDYDSEEEIKINREDTYQESDRMRRKNKRKKFFDSLSLPKVSQQQNFSLLESSYTTSMPNNKKLAEKFALLKISEKQNLSVLGTSYTMPAKKHWHHNTKNAKKNTFILEKMKILRQWIRTDIRKELKKLNGKKNTLLNKASNKQKTYAQIAREAIN